MTPARDTSTSALRARVADIIGQHPGLYAAAIAKHAGDPTPLAVSTIMYHLRHLVKRGTVTAFRDGREVHYFPAGYPRDEATRRAVATLRGAAWNVANALRWHPGMTQGELAGHIGIRQSTVAWHLTRLRDASLIRGWAGPRATQYELTPLARSLVEELDPMPRPAPAEVA